jgi:hypothetical protein
VESARDGTLRLGVQAVGRDRPVLDVVAIDETGRGGGGNAAAAEHRAGCAYGDVFVELHYRYSLGLLNSG